MRQYLALAAVLSLAAGAANAQFHPAPGYQPYQPVQPPALPKNPYALPEAPKPPRSSFEQPAPKPFEPIKPPKHVNLDEDSSGFYPELHRKPKHRANGGF